MWDKDYKDWEAYGRSKLANIYFTRKLAKIFKDKNMDIKAVSIHPGMIKTNILRNLNHNFFSKIFIPIAAYMFFKSSPR